ncbi:MAG: peptidylprolyl isomerase [Actinomycetota bacterium]
MATDKRERQRANRAAKQAEEDKVQQRAQYRQWVVIGVLIALGVGGLLYILSAIGGDDEATDTTDFTLASTSSTASTTTEPIPEAAVVAPEPGGSIDGAAECPAEDGSSERITSFNEAPPTCIDETATYVAEIDTTLGAITVELDASAAPETVNNFVFLARYHYYDGAPFHRIIPGFVIQGGDAVGDPLGTGNPGYAIGDELPTAGDYQVGSLAMANSGPDTSGSQFFIVTGPDGENLPPQYSLFGSVTEGLDVVTSIEGIPTTPSDAPTEEIYINSVTITEG